MTARTLRCAIYGRVSSDAGLEQDFNSLDAQRESAEAYIRSQAHEGWRLAPERFDDGGFSGGSMDRPALQRLLARIRERRVDIVVVYKVDRLTRSLADFAKLVDLFDAHNVSFVSVTQSFNTTSSMGRLTLNVLLSFAQFEREVTGERIRDKIAASKRKGVWMGGVVPHGYRVEARKLHIVEEEAAEVRLIFDLYLAHGSVRAVQRELAARAIRTRKRVLAKGRVLGGVAFANGPISHILRNRHYIGEINHKGRSWPGEHAPIIDRQVFEAAQEKLVGQRRFRLADRAKSHALLSGKLFNAAGERMTPTYALKNGVRYRYYISSAALQSREMSDSAVHRIPADAIEALAMAALDGASARADAPEDGRPASPQAAESVGASSLLTAPGGPCLWRDRVEAEIERIVVRADAVEIVRRCPEHADPSAGDPDAGDIDASAPDPGRPLTLTIPWTKPAARRRKEILQPEESGDKTRRMETDERMRLLRGVATARQWLDEMIRGACPDIAALAVRAGKTERPVRMTLSLAFLDPALIAAAVRGHLPRGFGVSRLANLPPHFADQWRALGLARPR